MKVQTPVILSENLLSTIEKYLERDKTLSDFIETALRLYISRLKQFKESSNDVEIINKNADYLNLETQDALQYQVEL